MLCVCMGLWLFPLVWGQFNNYNYNHHQLTPALGQTICNPRTSVCHGNWVVLLIMPILNFILIQLISIICCHETKQQVEFNKFIRVHPSPSEPIHRFFDLIPLLTGFPRSRRMPGGGYSDTTCHSGHNRFGLQREDLEPSQ